MTLISSSKNWCIITAYISTDGQRFLRPWTSGTTCCYIYIYVIMLPMTVGNITWSNSQINVFIIELTNQKHSKSLYISIYSAHWTPSCTDAFWMGLGFQLVRFPAPFKPRFMDYDTSQYKHIYICGGSITLNSWSINHNQNLSILCIYSI